MVLERVATVRLFLTVGVLLVLPYRTLGPAPLVQSPRGDLLDVVNHLRDGQRILRPKQGVPVIRHQHITAQQETEALPRSLERTDQQRVFGIPKGPDRSTQVDRNEEDSIRDAEAMNVGHRP